MSAAVTITRMDLTAAELRRAAVKSRDTRAARRMLAIALVLEAAAAALTDMRERLAMLDGILTAAVHEAQSARERAA